MKRRACIVPREQDVRRRESDARAASMPLETKQAALHKIRGWRRIDAVKSVMKDLGIGLHTALALMESNNAHRP